MKIAIVQDGPVFNDLTQTIVKTLNFIDQASEAGANLIVFGECWLSGYPVWLDVCKDVNLWDHEPIKQLWSNTYENSVDLASSVLEPIKNKLKEKGLYAVIGLNEKIATGKGNNSLYNSILTFDDEGNIVNHHRKLMPTFTEKLVHNLGDGKGLNAVETPFGRLGSLICWEHWMPMTRLAMHDEAEDIHIALWPYAKEMHHIASRHYAIEGRCFVVAVGQIMNLDELPEGLELSDEINLDNKLLLKGGSAVYSPSGEIILSPQYGNSSLIISEIDISAIQKERMNLAVSGHYQRPDVFNYTIDKSRRTD